MSFLKMTDPKKRDFIINEFFKPRQNIQQNFLSERAGELTHNTNFQSSSKQLRTCTKIQKKTL